MVNASNTQQVGLFKSIKIQLILWFLLLGLLPLMFMGIIAFSQAENTLRIETEEALMGVAETKALRVEDWLTDSGIIAKAISALPGIKGDLNPETIIGVGDIENI